MKQAFFILCLMIVIGTLAGCDGDPTSLPKNSIYGRVMDEDPPLPAAGVTVYLGGETPYPPVAIIFRDSTTTGVRGSYLFENLDAGRYVVYAGRKGGPGPSCFSHVSPLSQEISIAGKRHPAVTDLLLKPVIAEGGVSGQVLMAETEEPVENASVMLYRLEGLWYVMVDSTGSTAAGRYQFADVCTGNYRVFASLLVELEGPFTQYYAESCDIFCDGSGPLLIEPLRLTDLMVDKPAIYIYPEEDSRFRIELSLNNGTELVRSIPEYNSGWDVFVERSGRIDHQYDYLFYEASSALIPDLSIGWCIEGSRLATELKRLLFAFGLNAAETEAFLAYWLARLPEYSYYKVCPVVDADLDMWAGLQVEPRPDSMRRLWFFFQGRPDDQAMTPFQIPEFTRLGTTVIEWGGALLP